MGLPTRDGITDCTVQAITHCPERITQAGASAQYAWDEFTASLGNRHTRRAYERAIRRFLEESPPIPLIEIRPSMVAEFVRGLRTQGGCVPASIPTKKLALAALRRFFDYCVERHAIVLNPAGSVRAPRYAAVEGKTPALAPQDAQRVIDLIDVSEPIGLRDRVVIATFVFTAARVAAIAGLRGADFFGDGRQHYFRFHEKGGKQRIIPSRHDLQVYVEEYLEAVTGLGASSPLFRSCPGHGGALTERPFLADDMLRMVKRRLREAFLPAEVFSCHSFRAGTATNLLEQGVDPAEVQYLLGHSDPRTTRLYDRRQLSVSRNIVERIAV